MADVVESLILDPIVGDVSSPEDGQVWYNSVAGQMRAKDAAGVFDLRAGGGEQTKVSSNDTTAGYLEDKIQAANGSISVQVVNEGGNEHLAIESNLDETFLAQEIESQVNISTTSLTPVDAFAGSSLTITKDGDYMVFFEADTRMTNSNQEGALAVGLNGINAQVGSERHWGGNQRGSTVVVKKLIGLVIGDTIHGVYWKETAGMGSAELFNRSLTTFRIG